MKTFKNKTILVTFMKRSSLILNYLIQFVLLLSLFFTAGKFIEIVKLTLLVLVSYNLYKISVNSYSKDDLKAYNLLYIATIFIFVLYFAGYKYKLQFYISLGMLFSAYLGLFSSFLYKNKTRSIEIKKPIKIVNFNVEKKGKKEDLKQIIKEANALVKAEKELKKATTKKSKVKTVKKTVTKKKVVKKTTNKKTATKKKVVKKTKKN